MGLFCFPFPVAASTLRILKIHSCGSGDAAEQQGIQLEGGGPAKIGSSMSGSSIRSCRIRLGSNLLGSTLMISKYPHLHGLTKLISYLFNPVLTIPIFGPHNNKIADLGMPFLLVWASEILSHDSSPISAKLLNCLFLKSNNSVQLLAVF